MQQTKVRATRRPELVAQVAPDVAAGATREYAINYAMNNNVRHMNPLGPQFTRHALGDGAEAVLGSRKGCEPIPPTDGRCRTREKDASAASRHHDLGGLASSRNPAKHAISHTL